MREGVITLIQLGHRTLSMARDPVAEQFPPHP